MTFVAPIPPLADRIRADEQAMRIMRTLADMAEKIGKPPVAWEVEQRIGSHRTSFAPSLYSLLNADLIDRREPSGRLSLTRAGWEFLGEQPPFWMEDAA